MQWPCILLWIFFGQTVQPDLLAAAWTSEEANATTKRSAATAGAGQHLTPYDSQSGGGRRRNECDGPEEMHVILLDTTLPVMPAQQKEREYIARHAQPEWRIRCSHLRIARWLQKPILDLGNGVFVFLHILHVFPCRVYKKNLPVCLVQFHMVGRKHLNQIWYIGANQRFAVKHGRHLDFAH